MRHRNTSFVRSFEKYQLQCLQVSDELQSSDDVAISSTDSGCDIVRFAQIYNFIIECVKNQNIYTFVIYETLLTSRYFPLYSEFNVIVQKSKMQKFLHFSTF